MTPAKQAARIYGEDNTVNIRDAIRYAYETREDVNTRGAVTDDDVKAALAALAEDPFWIDVIKTDYRGAKLPELGRALETQITIARALRLQQPMV